MLLCMKAGIRGGHHVSLSLLCCYAVITGESIIIFSVVLEEEGLLGGLLFDVDTFRNDAVIIVHFKSYTFALLLWLLMEP